MYDWSTFSGRFILLKGFVTFLHTTALNLNITTITCSTIRLGYLFVATIYPDSGTTGDRTLTLHPVAPFTMYWWTSMCVAFNYSRASVQIAIPSIHCSCCH